MTNAKVRSQADAIRWRHAQSGLVVFTNGVFDLLHPGHVALLEQARANGTALVVGVNSDASVRRLAKGPDRPLVPAGDRARVLAALQSVDCVVVFDDETPLALITALKPDVLVKGADYDVAQIVGAKEVESWNGRVVRVPLVPNQSTTNLIKRLRSAEGGGADG